MNYIMGFMNINLEDEEITFKCFCQILKKYNREMFATKLEKLKTYFSKVTKIIELYLPRLAQHFKVISFYYNLIIKYIRKKMLIVHTMYQYGLSQYLRIHSNIL